MPSPYTSTGLLALRVEQLFTRSILGNRFWFNFPVCDKINWDERGLEQKKREREYSPIGTIRNSRKRSFIHIGIR